MMEIFTTEIYDCAGCDVRDETYRDASYVASVSTGFLLRSGDQIVVGDRVWQASAVRVIPSITVIIRAYVMDVGAHS